MGKYSIFNERSFLEDIGASDSDLQAISTVVNMLGKTGNRSSRRAAEKALVKTANIQNHCQAVAIERANKELGKKSDESLIWITIAVAMTLLEDYHWKENPENDHGQITAFLERMVNRMKKMQEEGKPVEQLAKELSDKTGIFVM